jgi:hypothetical protein
MESLEDTYCNECLLTIQQQHDIIRTTRKSHIYRAQSAVSFQRAIIPQDVPCDCWRTSLAIHRKEQAFKQMYPCRNNNDVKRTWVKYVDADESDGGEFEPFSDSCAESEPIQEPDTLQQIDLTMFEPNTRIHDKCYCCYPVEDFYLDNEEEDMNEESSSLTSSSKTSLLLHSVVRKLSFNTGE